MTYQRSSDFSTDNAEELRRDLRQMDDSVAAAFRALAVPMFSERRLVSADTVARLGELLIVDATGGSVDIKLPRAASVGTSGGVRTFGLVLTSASNVVRLLPIGDDTINRAASSTVAATAGYAGTIIFDGLEYWFPTRPAE